jgi:NAD-dependent deacetylase
MLPLIRNIAVIECLDSSRFSPASQPSNVSVCKAIAAHAQRAITGTETIMTLEIADLDAVHALAWDLRRARRVLVITGAGMSADSGVPTYRGFGGLYNGEKTEDGVAIEVALSGPMLRSKPALCWKYLGEIERGARGRQPHAGHYALTRLATLFESFTVLTQNVDDFHRSTGQADVIEMHGNLYALSCMSCAYETHVSDYDGMAIPPICPDCGGVIRPGVVLFGESLPRAAVLRLEQVLSDGVDIVVSIGTTSVFPYIAGPVISAARSGRPTAEINPGTSEVSHLVRHRIRACAAPVLEYLLALLMTSAPDEPTIGAA